MTEDELEEQMAFDSDALIELQELIGTLMVSTPVSTVFFLEMISTAWTYLRTLHTAEETAPLVREALIAAERYMTDEPLVTVRDGQGNSVEVPMYTAEFGGLAASDEAADALFELIRGE